MRFVSVNVWVAVAVSVSPSVWRGLLGSCLSLRGLCASASVSVSVSVSVCLLVSFPVSPSVYLCACRCGRFCLCLSVAVCVDVCLGVFVGVPMTLCMSECVSPNVSLCALQSCFDLRVLDLTHWKVCCRSAIESWQATRALVDHIPSESSDIIFVGTEDEGSSSEALMRA